MDLTAQCTLTRDEMEGRRLEAAREMLEGASQAVVARKFGVSRTTASRWHKALDVKGMEALRKRRAPGRPCRLTTAQLEQVRGIFAQSPRLFGANSDRWTTLLLARAIERHFGVHYDPDHVGRIMHRLGLRQGPVEAPETFAFATTPYPQNPELEAPRISSPAA